MTAASGAHARRRGPARGGGGGGGGGEGAFLPAVAELRQPRRDGVAGHPARRQGAGRAKAAWRADAA